MSDNKKYYYLKLKDNFYDSEQMIILQNMQDGYLYSDILMKLYLRSLKNEGRLMFNNIIPYTPQVLAQVVRHQVGTVEKALQVFQQLGLIEVLDNGAIYMLDIQNFIGKSSTEADRIRLYRDKIKKEEQKSIPASCTNVQELNDKNTLEIEKETDIDTDTELQQQKDTANDDAKLVKAIKFYQDNINLMTPFEFERLHEYEDMDEDLIIFAMQKSIEQNVKTMKYIEGILKSWKAKGIKTLAQAKEEDNKFQANKQRNKNSVQKSTQNFQKRNYTEVDWNSLYINKNEKSRR